MTCLNLGCGNDKKLGCINLDARQDVQPDVVWNIEQLPFPFPDNYFDEIIAKDIIEHLPYSKVRPVLKELHRILKPGGKIYIQVPDLEAIFYKIILGIYRDDFEAISYWVYGGQDYDYNFHKAGFTIIALRKILQLQGFIVDEIHNDGGTNIMCWARKV